MNNPETYLWQSLYVSAVLETDNAAMPSRLYEALAAIEQRLLSPIEVGGVEHQAIVDAQRGLIALKAERSGQNTRDYNSGRGDVLVLGKAVGNGSE